MSTGKSISFLNDFVDTWSEIYTDLPRSRRVKREWIKKGYEHQISLYGVVTEKEKEESEYRRIEILSNAPFTEETFFQFYSMFQVFIPIESYTIWTYDHETGWVSIVGSFR